MQRHGEAPDPSASRTLCTEDNPAEFNLGVDNQATDTYGRIQLTS